MTQQNKRIQFLDLMKGWVILIMIEVHVFNDTLTQSILTSKWFNIIHFINGLVAPTFLFVSGFVFIINAIQKKEKYFLFQSDFWKQIKRIFIVLIIGYLLHFPFDSLTKLINGQSTQWNVFYQSDILHCISIGWILLLLGRFIFKKDQSFQWFLLIGSLFFIFFSFYSWSNLYSINIFSAYLNSQISLFPLFPWVGFLFIGGWFGLLYQKSKENNEEKHYFKITLITSFLILILSILFSFIQIPVDWRINPFFFFIRLGIILIIMTSLWFYEKKKEIKSLILLTAGKESLFIYVGHLLILYTALFQGKKLSEIFSHQFNLFQSILATIILITIMLLTAKLWQYLKKREKIKKTIIIIFICLVLLLFFLQ